MGVGDGLPVSLPDSLAIKAALLTALFSERLLATNKYMYI